jgi:hypothetical protein
MVHLFEPSETMLSYCNDVASVVVIRLQGTFSNHWGYTSETWFADTFG